jgi:hypothetical protein
VALTLFCTRLSKTKKKKQLWHQVDHDDDDDEGEEILGVVDTYKQLVNFLFHRDEIPSMKERIITIAFLIKATSSDEK